MRRTLRSYHYLAVLPRDRENPHLVRERVKCGKPTCRCGQSPSAQHGPYWYLRWEEYHRPTDQVHYRREYVPATELARVRQWIRRARADKANSRAFLGFLRHYVSAMEYRARRRVRIRGGLA